MEEGMRCEIISWNQVQRLCRALALSIRKDGYHPDAIVTIARGGYVPARLLCDFLDIAILSSIRIEHYTGARKKPQALLVEPLNITVRNKHILLVDDVSDSGDTFALAIKHLQSHAPLTVKTAVLHHKTTSTVTPDYYGHKIVKWRWIIYPWALMEDISGFVAQMEKPPKNIEVAARILLEKYAIRAPKQVLQDVLPANKLMG